MKARSIVLSAVVAISGLSALGWWRHTIGRPRVRIVSVRVHPADSRPTSTAPVPTAAAGVELLDGGRLIAELDREMNLTDRQRADMDRALREVAAMQARIDLHDDPEERRAMQEKLVHQLIVRLRRILGEGNAKTIVVAIAEKQPRIIYE